MRSIVLLFLAASFAACVTPAWQPHVLTARTLLDAGNYSAAKGEVDLALADAEAAGPGDPALAPTLTFAAAVDAGLGRYREAEVRYRRAVSIYEQYHPDRRVELANALQGFGALYTTERQWSRAEPLYTRAHDLLVQEYGPNHPAVAGILATMGELCQELGQYAKAEDLYLDAKAILQRHADSAAMDVADLDQNIATLYATTGRSADAEELFRMAIKIYRSASPKHPHLAIALRNLADFETAHQNFAGAESLFLEGLHICEVSLGPSSPETAVVLESYSRFLMKVKRGKEAKAVAGRSQAIVAKSMTENRSADIVDWRNLARK